MEHAWDEFESVHFAHARRHGFALRGPPNAMYGLIPHPAYSPDLAPSDFFLFPNLKKDIRGLHFRSDEEVVTAVEECVNGKDPDFFSSGLMALEHHWSKCITLEGNNIEKEEVDLNRK